MQLNKNEDVEMDADVDDQSEIELILRQTANSINAFKANIEDERDRTAIDKAQKVDMSFKIRQNSVFHRSLRDSCRKRKVNVKLVANSMKRQLKIFELT